jgi:hypothetical protein
VGGVSTVTRVYVHHHYGPFYFHSHGYGVGGSASSGSGWAELTAWGTLVIALGIIAAALGAWVAARQLSETKKNRYTDSFMNMVSAWDRNDLIAVRKSLFNMSPEQFKEHYFASYTANTSEFYELLKLGNFFEYFGILESRDSLSLDLIDTVLGPSVQYYWKMWKLAIEEEEKTWPNFYANWTSLAANITARRGGQMI